MTNLPPDDPLLGPKLDRGMHDTLRWALDASGDPAKATANWLAAEIAPEAPNAEAAIASADLQRLTELKTAFKAMRTTAASVAERNLAARLYAASIASALLRHDRRISGQSDRALRLAFESLRDDPLADESLREIARAALPKLGAG